MLSGTISRPQQRNLVCSPKKLCPSCVARRAHSDAPSHVAGDPRELSGDEGEGLSSRAAVRPPSSYFLANDLTFGEGGIFWGEEKYYEEEAHILKSN